jgi:endonuclease/exonuclease/phosphatase family metal-dependent hydrolase
VGHIRAQVDSAAPRWAYGLVLGLAFDVALRSLFGVMDLSTISGAIPIVIVVVIAILIFWAVWREPVVEAGIPTGAAWKVALPLMAIGPYLVLQLLFFQSQGWVEEVAGLEAPLGFVIVMLGNLAAAVGVAWGFARPRTLRPPIAVGVAIYLTLAVYSIDQPGGLILVTILIGQLLMGWGWAVLSGVGVQVDRPGLRRTTVAVAGGMVLFLALAFAFYLAMDVAMPLPRQAFPAIAGALLGLFLLLASLQTGSLGESAPWELSGVTTAGVLVIVSLISWVLIDPVPMPEQPGSYPVKIMSYNVHSGFAMEGEHDLEAIAKVIEDSGADIIALQEVSRVRLMDGAVDIPSWLSRRLDMPVVFRGTEEPIWGNAILSRYPIVESGWGELPLAGKLMERGFVWARIDVGGPEPLLVIDTHLHHIGPDTLARQEQVPVLLQFWNDQGYSVLLGDLNATPDSPEMKLIFDAGLLDSWSEAGVGSGYTSNARDPHQRIDWIWHTDDLTTVEVEVLQTQASDHLPVLATLGVAP